MDSLETKLSHPGGQAPLILTFREETSVVLDRKLPLSLMPVKNQSFSQQMHVHGMKFSVST